jgi:hypothetical protein
VAADAKGVELFHRAAANMKKPPGKSSAAPRAVSAARAEGAISLRAEFRAWLRPERRWHYAFHGLTVLVASAYWLLSLLVSRGGLRTFAETVLYRPEGDNQLWPVITALSQFNFGDPTDAFHYGEGHTSVTILSMLPYLLACAVFGLGGYVVADIVCALLYFAAIFLLLRVCGAGRFTSLVLGSLLTIGLPQLLTSHLGGAFTMVIDPFGLVAAEHYFPNLLELKIYGTRVQRPVVTEIWGVLLMAGLVQLWREPAKARVALGVCLGALMGALVQGDPFFLGVLGLTFCFVLARTARQQGWRPTTRLLLGMALGAGVVLAHFIYQRLTEHPDIPRRLGLTRYDRWHPLFLPGYAPLVRVAVVAALAWLLCRLAWKRTPAAAGTRLPARFFLGLEPLLGVFLTGMLVAAYFAQPMQVLLIAQGAQIYHYLHIVPIFYSYALVILLYHIVRLTAAGGLLELWQRLGGQPGRAGAVTLVVALVLCAMLVIEKPVKRMYSNGTVCGASVQYQPWGKFGDDYRPALSKLDRGLLRDPKFARIKTFATFNQDIYVLLSAFRGKRAFVPDAALTTLPDAEIEDRLCIMAKIFGFSVEQFVSMLQEEQIKNYFLGSNKYRFASDYRFSADTNDYRPVLFEQFIENKHHKQWGWFLAIPKSELQRMAMRYVELQARPPNVALYPDLIILDHNEVALGYVPSPNFYTQMGTNGVFRIFGKTDLLR